MAPSEATDNNKRFRGPSSEPLSTQAEIQALKEELASLKEEVRMGHKLVAHELTTSRDVVTRTLLQVEKVTKGQEATVAGLKRSILFCPPEFTSLNNGKLSFQALDNGSPYSPIGFFTTLFQRLGHKHNMNVSNVKIIDCFLQEDKRTREQLVKYNDKNHVVTLTFSSDIGAQEAELVFTREFPGNGRTTKMRPWRGPIQQQQKRTTWASYAVADNKTPAADRKRAEEILKWQKELETRLTSPDPMVRLLALADRGKFPRVPLYSNPSAATGSNTLPLPDAHLQQQSAATCSHVNDMTDGPTL